FGRRASGFGSPLKILRGETFSRWLKPAFLPSRSRGAEETVSQLLFRTFGACSSTTFYPRLAPWAAFLRRFAARIVTRGPLFVQSGGCDTVSEAPGYWQMSLRDTRKSELAFIARSLTS